MLIRISIIISIIMLLSILICGVWISSNSGQMSGDEYNSSVSFHRNLGITTVLVSVITFISVLFKFKGNK